MSKRQVHSPDWRDMDRGMFDTTSPYGPLFILEPAQVAADDGCGTGDLLEFL